MVRDIAKKIAKLTFVLCPPPLLINIRVKMFVKHSLLNSDYNGKPFSEDVDENMAIFLSKGQASDKEYVAVLQKDIVKCYLLYGITPDEYFMHSLQNKSLSYKRSILSRKYKDELTINSLGEGWKEYFSQLKDKWEFYQLAEKFFKRDVCKVEAEDDFIEVQQFVKKHSVFIAKPRSSSCGIGVHLVKMEDFNNDPKIVFDKYKNMDDGNWIFEEKIVQDERMAHWHQNSVNTIRIPSFRTKHGIKVLLPLFRTGKNGNLVDNCHNDGGLMAVPDEKSGVLISDGYDVFTNVVKEHPNSHMVFKGWQVPEWDNLIATAKALHESLPPKHKYVGFDFALTSNGWVVVEGNWGNFPHQVCVGRGIRKEFEMLMQDK